ncbi:MAG: S8 family serine peptidase [Ignavibacteriae bacterium]|nr:S8 family serine peptidase [Ignavibacteriota bacterium]
MKRTVLVISILLATISSALAQREAPLGKLLNRAYPTLQDNDRALILVCFVDKGNIHQYRISKAESFISERAIKRRMKVRSNTTVVDEHDYPLEQSYVNAVAQRVLQLRHQLKWFNAVSAVATKRQIESLRNLPFVKEIDLVGRWRINRDLEREIPTKEQVREKWQPAGVFTLDYGTSFTQLNQIKVPDVHNIGIYGQGIVIGVFDDGFRRLTHQAFDSMDIIDTYDFVDHKVSVVPNDPTAGGHGVNTLSTIGGFRSGQLIGPAFQSSYILARTENDSSETPVEEDNWAKAIEWADSIGVDVTSTSLGYLTYDPPYTSWTWQDMDGNTTLITQAGDRAAELGIVVVNSAGNNGFNATQNTLSAPADGDTIIAAGAVDSFGVRTSFSSVGPTFDGRTKPDVMAMGRAVKVASSLNDTGYARSNGTSFSCPLSAGVAALVLSAHPTLTPYQVRQAMRQTASQANSPDNLMGWGILNALNAVTYYVPRISGMKFNDLNGNGVRDVGEPGVGGVKIRLTGTITDSTLTSSSGDYIFDSLIVGSYDVTEEIPAGWIQTFPPTGSYTIMIDSLNSHITGKDFGDFQFGSISGVKFEDLNGNSVRDTGEPVLLGWQIMLTGADTMSTTTDSAGTYSFTNVTPGDYTLSESLQVGWVQSVPVGSYLVTMYSGLDTSSLDFGNYRPGSIHGVKFNDLNQNGIRDSGEVGLQGWGILLNGTASAFTATDSNGNYWFMNLSPGTYTVSESTQTGWVQTLPPNNGSYAITLRSGLDTTGLDFGNHSNPAIIYPVSQGWNLLSLPREVVDNLKSAIYPTAVSQAFMYNSGYIVIDTIPNSIGYWLKFSSTQNIKIKGDDRLQDTIDVSAGWNIIGTLSSPMPVANMGQIPDSNVISIFSYDPRLGTYGGVNTFLPGIGYWVKVRTNGQLILSQQKKTISK